MSSDTRDGFRVALVCTVYNEGQRMKELLASVVNQTRQPDEAVFVDGGSTDDTQDVLWEYADKYPWITVIVEDGCNIAEGRNIGIRATDAEIIATTDGGCILDDRWLENLLTNFPEADVSAGVWKPLTDNSRFKEVLAILECPDPETLPEDWPPSSRSQAFKKAVWEEVGGYPEDLYTAEDTEFNRRIKDAGFTYRVARDAFVYWEMRDSLSGVWNQYVLYGVGDARNNTVKSVLTGNYNAVKSSALLGLVVVSFTAVLGVVNWMYAAPGLISLLVLLLYRVHELGWNVFNPVYLLTFLVLNAVMRYGYAAGFAKELV